MDKSTEHFLEDNTCNTMFIIYLIIYPQCARDPDNEGRVQCSFKINENILGKINS